MLTYILVCFGGIAAGGSDLVSAGKALASAIGVAVLGRLLLAVLGWVPARGGDGADLAPRGSRIDLVSAESDIEAALTPRIRPNEQRMGRE